MKNFIFIIIAVLAFVPFILSAQSDSNLTFSISPSNPKPYEQVTVSLISYGYDLSKYYIDWNLNGKNIAYGQGRKTASFQLGNIGEPSKLTLTIKIPNGTDIIKTVTINPSIIDLIWQSNTYVPYFYKGKALATNDSLIKVVALPKMANNQGKIINSDKLVYRWTMDGFYYGNSSGLAKNYFIFNLDSNGNKIELEVNDPETGIKNKSQISINPRKPELILYAKKPLMGIDYSKSLEKEYLLEEPEITIKAEPYFFPFKNWLELNFDWLVNNEKIGVPENFPSEITLRKKEGTTGATTLDLKLKNTNNNEVVSRSLIIKFNQ